ncbi:MAG TPA: hypothetical protein VFE62_21445 [Gemmataceae bacterium]|nr:hypothetical protein [Gemmataceae bacterium]
MEGELRRLKQIVQGHEEDPWWKHVVGSHENDPVFAEIVKLGREIRTGERTSTKRRKASKPGSKRSRAADERG